MNNNAPEIDLRITRLIDDAREASLEAERRISQLSNALFKRATEVGTADMSEKQRRLMSAEYHDATGLLAHIMPVAELADNLWRRHHNNPLKDKDGHPTKSFEQYHDSKPKRAKKPKPT